jgi:hypothetical protein
MKKLSCCLFMLSLFLLVSGCQDSLNRAVSTLFKTNQAGTAQQQRGGEAWNLTPEEKARIEAKVRNYGKYPASAAVSDWAVGPDPDSPNSRVGSVLVEIGKKRKTKQLFAVWSFRLPRNGESDDIFYVGDCQATPSGYTLVDSPADPAGGGDELAQRELFDRVMRLRQR